MINVKEITRDDSTLTRSLEIKIGTESLYTPAVASDIPSSLDSIGEIYIEVKSTHDEEDISLTRRFLMKHSKLEKARAFIVVINFSEPVKHQTVPVTAIFDALTEISRLAPILICGPSMKKGKWEDFANLTSVFTSEAQSRGFKIFPMFVPRIIDPIKQLEYLYKYNKHGINYELVCIDYSGSNPFSKNQDHLKYVAILRELEKEYGPTVTYGVNIHPIFYASKYPVAPAKDLASFYAHIDIIGARSHVRRVPPLTGYNVKASYKYLLNVEGYIYERSEVVSDVEIHNISKKIEESHKLFDLIKRGESLLDYLKNKEISRVDEKILKLIRRFVSTYKASLL
ncbi:hypothetical protein ODS41_02510 [Pyrobaculum sp. 3827-6]|uniref:hypothetical protein n=1 Tax=Pyrobaculum sp. 3827-6 TaxID=2983604 RepID=UPI0021DB0064|nr:hypothetical protein [Pyrobaculum sp. 3827-6]MCU7786803.1 hypothetical protein [Pyrobaculum sp. 3827-6]